MNEFFTRIRDFLTEYLPNQRCLAANTIRSYRQALNLFVSHLRDQRGLNLAQAGFADIDRAVVAGFLDWLEEARRCSASTRNQRLMALRAFFDLNSRPGCDVVAAA
jgi:site-specific recombinase XerD